MRARRAPARARTAARRRAARSWARAARGRARAAGPRSCSRRFPGAPLEIVGELFAEAPRAAPPAVRLDRAEHVVDVVLLDLGGHLGAGVLQGDVRAPGRLLTLSPATQQTHAPFLPLWQRRR